MLAGLLALSGCGYNSIQAADEDVKAAWAEVQNQYPAPHRPGSQPGQHREGRRGLRAGDAAGRGGGALSGGQDQGRPEAAGGPSRLPALPAGAGAARRRPPAADGRGGALPASSATRRPSATCRPSSRAPRTASRWRAAATSRASAAYNKLVRQFPTNLTARFILEVDVRPTFEAPAGAEQPPKVEF